MIPQTADYDTADALLDLADRHAESGDDATAQLLRAAGIAHRQMRRTLDEIAGDAWEDERLACVPQRRAVLRVIEGGRV